ncbi:unnamed protein product [Boreogadus saida]
MQCLTLYLPGLHAWYISTPDNGVHLKNSERLPSSGQLERQVLAQWRLPPPLKGDRGQEGSLGTPGGHSEGRPSVLLRGPRTKPKAG